MGHSKEYFIKQLNLNPCSTVNISSTGLGPGGMDSQVSGHADTPHQ